MAERLRPRKAGRWIDRDRCMGAHSSMGLRPDHFLLGMERYRPPGAGPLALAERRFEILRKVNKAGRVDLIRAAAYDWTLLEKLAEGIGA